MENMEDSLFGMWNPTKQALTGLQTLRNTLAKEEAFLELEIYTLKNEKIHSQYAFDILTLLEEWQNQEQPFGNLNIAFFHPAPIHTIYSPDGSSGAMPIHSNEHTVVMYLGVIDNLSEIQEKLFSYGYEWNTKNVAETLSYLFRSYLEPGYISPISAMQMIMKTVKGHFALMVLLRKGDWLMVGCSNYPLAICKTEPTVYFSSDTEILNFFSSSSSSIIPVTGKPKPTMFCITSFRKDMILPIPL